MVEYPSNVDEVFRAIGHPVRRAVLEQLATGSARVTELAGQFEVSLAAVSKHIKVLEGAGLVRRQVRGRDHWLTLETADLETAEHWLSGCREFWERSLDRLDAEIRRS
jgi:DNA-binding transcriptional ArsR family regulator